jgi:hypothetical protein
MRFTVSTEAEQLTKIESGKCELAIRPPLSSAGKAGEGARTGGLSRLCTAGNAQASAQAEWFGIFIGTLKRLSELYRVDIVLPTVEGREIWLRGITKLGDQQQKILHHLHVQLPELLEPTQILNVVKTRP